MHALESVDESELVRRSQDGDPAAFENLYRLHAGRVHGLCRRLTADEGEAQDCTQETFVRAWQRLDAFRGDASLATWLHKIAVNEVLGRKRRRSIERRYLELVDRSAVAAQDDHGELAELERAIEALPDRARQVFVLQRIYGHTHEQVAEMLDIAVGTCKAQVHRASRLLIEALHLKPADGGTVVTTPPARASAED
jgi:RNA polymerase sigma-70 factor, ECF subfamily